MSTPIKILIVDDSKTILLGLETIFRSDTCNTYELFFTNNGRDAYSMALCNRPDIILLDLEMPIISGLETLDLIRNVNKLKSIPVIVMSNSRNFNAALETGANDFLMKPLSHFEVLQRIKLNLSLAKKALELRASNERLKTQKRETDLQKDIVELQKKELLDDLKYASYLQQAILPEEDYLKEVLPEHFIYYVPKNIVSGDFYWITHKVGLIFFAVGDCTGHGLSGALMSMMGPSLLYEIIIGHNILEPDLILNTLRTRVINLLHQKGNIGEASNGMDLALCVYDKNKHILKYAGANNPMYIVRKNNDLEIFKANRMPIGIHLNHINSFTCQETIIGKDDSIYLFTDGYADQFGGEEDQKFRYNRFQDLLRKISILPKGQQLELLSTTMNEWKGKNEQVDDMLILGIKLL